MEVQQKWVVGWGFTARCDLRCPFCYSSRVRAGAAAAELDLRDAEAFLQNNRHSIASLNFGTGECFLAPRFPDLLALCRGIIPDVEIAVTTNGAIVDAARRSKRNAEIIHATIDELDVSVDFPEAAAHDAWRGKRGCWQRAIDAIRFGLDAGIRTTMVSIGTRKTLTTENLSGLFGLAEELGVPLRINLFMPTTGDFTFVPGIDVVIDSLQLLAGRSETLRSSDPLLGSLMACYRPGEHLRDQHSCRILPDGRVTPSTYLIEEPWVNEGSLADRHLDDLAGTPSFARMRRGEIPEECESCELVPTCRGGSIERRWLWHRDLSRRDPFCAGSERLRELDFGEARDWSGPTVHLDYLPTIIAIPHA